MVFQPTCNLRKGNSGKATAPAQARGRYGILSYSLPFLLCSPRTCSSLHHPLKFVSNTFWHTPSVCFVWRPHKHYALRLYQLEDSLIGHFQSMDTIGTTPSSYSLVRWMLLTMYEPLSLPSSKHLESCLGPLPLQLYKLKMKMQNTLCLPKL